MNHFNPAQNENQPHPLTAHIGYSAKHEKLIWNILLNKPMQLLINYKTYLCTFGRHLGDVSERSNEKYLRAITCGRRGGKDFYALCGFYTDDIYCDFRTVLNLIKSRTPSSIVLCQSTLIKITLLIPMPVTTDIKSNGPNWQENSNTLWDTNSHILKRYFGSMNAFWSVLISIGH